MKFPVIKIRRLKILGTAMLLSVIAAAIGVTLYFLPPTFASLNTIGDFIAINDALFAVRDQKWLAQIAHFPHNHPPPPTPPPGPPDEATLQDPPKGLGRQPIPRNPIGDLLVRLSQAGAKVAAFDLEFFEHTRDPKEDAVFKAG